MIKPNWDVFRAKFSDDKQGYFEWFCYLLFCKELKRPFGVFRYKNQHAIETNLVKRIGWQAKFYDTSLSNHTSDILKTIEDAKKKYSSIKKLLFYTNQEWGQTREGKAPQGQIDAENKAKELEIELEWRIASFFESPFVTTKNEVIAKHFFVLNNSTLDLIESFKEHGERLLEEIGTSIDFKGKDIEIDQKETIEKLTKSETKVTILSGVGGVGKTAVIKKVHQNLDPKIPFYIFKALEFEVRNVNDLFPDSNLKDFLEIHKDEKQKILVIDSAEKLLDLKNTSPFKEFLQALVKDSWQLIFTTRENYLENLNYEFFEIYKIKPENLRLENITQKELTELSDEYEFSLPTDKKLLDLIRNPFYLNEYLKFYKEGENLNYKSFKEKLWKKNITKTKPSRSECFLKTALERAHSGNFFVVPNVGNTQVLDELVGDGILRYEETYGYFITHDIYEEWALEMIIQREFSDRSDNKKFFETIGDQLPIRRSFRNWLSDKLLLGDTDIKSFIEESIKDPEIPSHWKDEILISVLLSEHAKYFFTLFKDELLKDNQKLLRKITFLLRIACKEPDDTLLQLIGAKNTDLLSLKYILTKPRGRGWEVIIKFVFDNLDEIGLDKIYFILPVIHDWNTKFKQEETTKLSSLIALKLYQRLIDDDVFMSDKDLKKKILQTILYGSLEVKEELKNILEEVIKNKWKGHRDPYHELSEMILKTLEGLPVCQALPTQVLQLADLFWTYTPKEGRFGIIESRDSLGGEKYFGIEDHLGYSPESPYQTPIFWLLQYSFKETVNFILQFTNKAVAELSKHNPEEVEVYLDEKSTIKQCISTNLWCLYRGTQGGPSVLQCMHMALEKFFLERGKDMDSKILESWLLYLISNSKSASISALVSSIVLAYPEKTFNIAKILFKTKEFFRYDTGRWTLDRQHKSSLSSVQEMFGGYRHEDKIHENERIESCDKEHRKFALEHLFFNYQWIRNEGTSEETALERQKILWEILDDYYKKLPKKKDETEDDKTWKCYLNRMDRRGMKPEFKKTEKGAEIHWKTDIDPELKKFSEEGLKQSSELLEHTSLSIWASLKMRKDDKFKEYEKYEKDPKTALKEAKKIADKLSQINKPEKYQTEHTSDESFYLVNSSIPTDVCSVLIRDHLEILTKKEKEFCRDIVLKAVSEFVKSDFDFKISDHARSALQAFPNLLIEFPEEREQIKTLLLLSLFSNHSVDMAGTSFSIFPSLAIHQLWKDYFDDAQSLLLGYLLLKPKYEKLRKQVREDNYKKGIYGTSESDLIEKFLKKHRKDIEKVVNNKLKGYDLKDLDLNTLKTAFHIVPLENRTDDHEQLGKDIIEIFSKTLLSTEREDRVDYHTRHDFSRRLASFVLTSPKKKIPEYLKPFLDDFNVSEGMSELLEAFITVEDYLGKHENFWEVWNLFKKKIIESHEKRNGDWYISKVIENYLFGRMSWKESATDWHSLKDENKLFFSEVSQKLGSSPSTLYSISKLLNDIGSSYVSEGVFWISKILKNNPNLKTAKLEVNTVYYLENLVRKYIYENREKVRRTKKTRDDILVILDFLLEKGSVVGYILRESIL